MIRYEFDDGWTVTMRDYETVDEYASNLDIMKSMLWMANMVLEPCVIEIATLRIKFNKSWRITAIELDATGRPTIVSGNGTDSLDPFVQRQINIVPGKILATNNKRWLNISRPVSIEREVIYDFISMLRIMQFDKAMLLFLMRMEERS